MVKSGFSLETFESAFFTFSNFVMVNEIEC
jgi:hypothetical protein